MFEVARCPAHRSILAWIEDEVGGWPQMPTRFEPNLHLPEFTYDESQLAQECTQLRDELGFVPWRSTEGGALIGMSTHYDPQQPLSDMYVGSFGHPRYQRAGPADYYQLPAKELSQAPRMDYLDSLGFRKVCPAVTLKPAFMRVISGFRVPVVRGTIRVIEGSQAFASREDGVGMHTDANPCKAMRVNLSVQTSDDFGLQYEGHAPLISKSGEHRIVCTDFNHRAWIRKRNKVQRIHFVFDVLPWLAYDASRDAYSLNEFFGRKHPYDMVVERNIWKGR